MDSNTPNKRRKGIPFAFDPDFPDQNDPRFRDLDGAADHWHPSQPTRNEWDDWGSNRPLFNISTNEEIELSGLELDGLDADLALFSPSAVEGYGSDVGFSSADGVGAGMSAANAATATGATAGAAEAPALEHLTSVDPADVTWDFLGLGHAFSADVPVALDTPAAPSAPSATSRQPPVPPTTASSFSPPPPISVPSSAGVASNPAPATASAPPPAPASTSHAFGFPPVVPGTFAATAAATAMNAAATSLAPPPAPGPALSSASVSTGTLPDLGTPTSGLGTPGFGALGLPFLLQPSTASAVGGPSAATGTGSDSGSQGAVHAPPPISVPTQPRTTWQVPIGGTAPAHNHPPPSVSATAPSAPASVSTGDRYTVGNTLRAGAPRAGFVSGAVGAPGGQVSSDVFGNLGAQLPLQAASLGRGFNFASLGLGAELNSLIGPDLGSPFASQAVDLSTPGLGAGFGDGLTPLVTMEPQTQPARPVTASGVVQPVSMPPPGSAAPAIRTGTPPSTFENAIAPSSIPQRISPASPGFAQGSITSALSTSAAPASAASASTRVPRSSGLSASMSASPASGVVSLASSFPPFADSELASGYTPIPSSVLDGPPSAGRAPVPNGAGGTSAARSTTQAGSKAESPEDDEDDEFKGLDPADKRYRLKKRAARVRQKTYHNSMAHAVATLKEEIELLSRHIWANTDGPLLPELRSALRHRHWDEYHQGEPINVRVTEATRVRATPEQRRTRLPRLAATLEDARAALQAAIVENGYLLWAAYNTSNPSTATSASGQLHPAAELAKVLQLSPDQSSQLLKFGRDVKNSREEGKVVSKLLAQLRGFDRLPDSWQSDLDGVASRVFRARQLPVFRAFSERLQHRIKSFRAGPAP